MSEFFSSAWLALRGSADRRARSVRLPAEVAVVLRERNRPARIIDLGCGTGANAHFLATRLLIGQEWLLVDDNERHLREAVEGFSIQPTPIQTEVVDLANASADGLTAGRDLVTASALLDLVSERWLKSLIEACSRQKAAVLFALTYDGHVLGEPSDPDDQWVIELVNAHQRTDKGFGPALGPSAAVVLERLLDQAGYVHKHEPSDWILTSDEALQRELILGWASAAREMGGVKGEPRITNWCERRLAHVDSGHSRLTVGHVDVAGWPRNSVG